MKYVIQVSKWRAGGDSDGPNKLGEGPTLLENKEGYMCCLGQIVQQHNPYRALKHYESPATLPPNSAPDWLLDGIFDSHIGQLMMSVNDNTNITTEDRKARLKELAKQAGHELEFVES